jgi:dGTPase
MLGEVFNYFVGHPAALPREVAKHAAAGDAHRVICDHVASMTDRYLIQEHRRLFGLDLGGL